MKRSLTSGPLVVAVCVSLSGAAAVAAPALASSHHKKVAPARLLVYAQEWSLLPSRASLPAGTVVVQLENRGQDQHDLRIRKLNSDGDMTGPVLGKVKITNPGDLSQATWHLKQTGKYELFCSLPGHMKMGMHAKISVTKAKKH